jgi:endonuclease III
MKSATIDQIHTLLQGTYGQRQLVPNHEPVRELVLTILSQNTSDVNSRRAFESLINRFTNWEDILNAEKIDVAESIKSGGLGLIKAGRIQAALSEISQQRGLINLDFLADLPVPKAREWLIKLPGVGNKTANCVLLFALGKPALPVDTHIFRVSKRLKLIPEVTSLDEAHKRLAEKVPSDLVYSFHVLMIEHGRKTCSAQRPRCQSCILKALCPSCDKFVTKSARITRK